MRSWLAPLRPVLAMSGLFAAAAIIGERNATTSWPVWLLGVVLTTAAAFVLAYMLGLPAAQRRAAAQRVRAALGVGQGSAHA